MFFPLRSTWVSAVTAVLIVLWIGGLWTVGYVVVPVLFTNLSDTRLAGVLAGKLFEIQAVIGGVIGGGLWALSWHSAKIFNPLRKIRWIVFVMLLCLIINALGLQPKMNVLKAQAAIAGVQVGASVYKDTFARLHGFSSSLFLVQSLLGMVLVWRLVASTQDEMAKR